MGKVPAAGVSRKLWGLRPTVCLNGALIEPVVKEQLAPSASYAWPQGNAISFNHPVRFLLLPPILLIRN